MQQRIRYTTRRETTRCDAATLTGRINTPHFNSLGLSIDSLNSSLNDSPNISLGIVFGDTYEHNAATLPQCGHAFIAFICVVLKIATFKFGIRQHYFFGI
jgi:hypothetical protein